MTRTALALTALLLAAPAAAQVEIEVMPLDPPEVEPDGSGDASGQGAGAFRAPPQDGETALDGARTAPGDDGTQTPDEAEARATVEFKRAPFRTADIPRAPEPIPSVPTRPADGAVLRLLDLMTAETREVALERGETRRVAGLSVTLGDCEAAADGGIKGTRAHLEVRDARNPEEGALFTGWMFADSPALSAMDHRRYDLWLISCTSSDGEVASGSE